MTGDLARLFGPANELGLTPDLLQTFCAMLRAAAEQAYWDLALDHAASVTPGVLPHPRPFHLH
ncbi:MAG: hypothetical protein ACK4FE_12820 [Azonexus sp.]